MKNIFNTVLKRGYLMLRRLKRAMRNDMRNSHSFSPHSNDGPLVQEVFKHIKLMPGWFNIDDCSHFFIMLSLQSAMGIKGDLLEIGSYHGRSTALLAYCLREDEKIVVCDAFEMDTEDRYSERPSEQRLLENVSLVNPNMDLAKIEIHTCYSSELHLKAERKFRFIHVDGGHSEEAAYGDLKICEQHLVVGGIVAIDDYMHKKWPGVTTAVNKFLKETDDFYVLADLNRYGAVGRKLYLFRRPSSN